MNKFLLILCCLLGLFGGAQPEKNNWYFGDRAAISFETGQPVVKYDNPQNIYGTSASISHPVTGKLLFYSNGIDVWNDQHKIMANGGSISNGQVGEVHIVPDPAHSLQYYVFYSENSTIKYVVVDMNQNSGEGLVTVNPLPLISNQLFQFTAVYHPYKKAFWIISHTYYTNEFNITLVDSTGPVLPPLVSKVGLIPGIYGDMVVNHASNRFVVTHYQENDNHAEVFDFDPVCGSVSNSIVLDKIDVWDRPYGAAFSPDDSKLYITYSYERSQLIQYYGANFENNYLIADAPDNFNVIRLANDGKMYLATHNGGIPGPRIDAVLDPDKLGPDCKYVKTYLTTDDGTGRHANFELPAFVSGKVFRSPVSDNIFTSNGACLGLPTEFTFNEKNPFDSLRWDFGEDGSTSKETKTKHTYLTGGKFVVTLSVFKCGKSFEMVDTIRIDNPPKGSFASDTVLCYGLGLKLNGPQADQYLWSTGETTSSIIVKKPGLVWLKSTNGTCSGFDSIKVSYYDNIFTVLGDEYFICDDDKELVKLDAGEGFDQYKWTPTGDTSQWIIVGDLGKYFVVVKDFRGCDGKDGTKVERRCPVSVFYPNVFTPNNDGLNDVFLPVGNDVVEFTIRIYNAWGQRVFESKELSAGWDGKLNGIAAPDGTYFYQSSYSGYRNKHLVSFETKGNLTLLR